MVWFSSIFWVVFFIATNYWTAKKPNESLSKSWKLYDITSILTWICLKVETYFQTIAFEMESIWKKNNSNIYKTIEMFVEGVSPPFVGNITAQTEGSTKKNYNKNIYIYTYSNSLVHFILHILNPSIQSFIVCQFTFVWNN